VSGDASVADVRLAVRACHASARECRDVAAAYVVERAVFDLPGAYFALGAARVAAVDAERLAAAGWPDGVAEVIRFAARECRRAHDLAHAAVSAVAALVNEAVED
jgi:hypothetical protein